MDLFRQLIQPREIKKQTVFIKKELTLIKKNNPNYCISILGCGWLGLPLATRLVQLGNQVKGSTTSPQKMAVIKSAGIIPYLIKLTEPEPRFSDFLNADILIITIPLKQINPFDNLIKQLPTTIKVIYTSSTDVYLPSAEPINEKGALDMGHSLLMIEQIIQNASNQSTIIRLAGLFDQRRHPGRWFTNKLLTNPDNPVNLIHLYDCMGIIEKIITHQVWEEVFNACADEHPIRKDFYSRASQLIGHPPPQINKESSSNKIISNNLVKEKLNYSFLVPLNSFENHI